MAEVKASARAKAMALTRVKASASAKARAVTREVRAMCNWLY